MSRKGSHISSLYEQLRTRFNATATSHLAKQIEQLGAVSSRDPEAIAIGSSYPIFLEDSIKELMRLWVKSMDALINECLYHQLDPLEPIAVLLKLHRGVSYEEFQMVLKTSDYDSIHIDEKDYKYFRAYDFFKIADKVERKRFITQHPYDKDNFQDYVSMLEHYQVPPMSFFLTQKLPALLPFSSLLKHSYLTAGSGAGKTELMKLIIYNLQGKTQQHKNASIVVFDPQGDFSRECLKFKMNADASRIIYIDLYIHKELQKVSLIAEKESTFSPVINPFDIDEKTVDAVGKMTVELSRAFEELLQESTITGNMQTFLHPCISTLLFREGSSIRELQRFMQDGNNEDLRQLGYQNPIPDHRSFFVSGGFDIPLYKKTKDALYQKIQQLLNLPNFSRLMVGKSTIDLRKAVNSGKVVLFNLSKGELTPATSHAFGKILLAIIQGIGFRRVDTQKEHRKNTFVIVDEFQNFAISYVKNMLEEIRQYKIGFLMAQQYAGQGMEKGFLDSILTNTTIKIIGNNDPNTFGELARSTGISQEQLKALPKHNFYIFNRDAKTSKVEQKYFQIKTPNVLVDTSNTAFYLDKAAYKDLLHHLVFVSGFYVKDTLNINAGVDSEQKQPNDAFTEDRREQQAKKTSKKRTPTDQVNSKEHKPSPKYPL